MGLASNQARLNVLTCRRADLEYRLMVLSGQQQRLAVESAQAVANKAQALEAYIANANNNNVEDVKVGFESTAAYMDYEVAMNELEAAESRLDMQREAAQTELTAVSKEEEEIEKLVQSNVKNSFNYFN